ERASGRGLALAGRRRRGRGRGVLVAAANREAVLPRVVLRRVLHRHRREQYTAHRLLLSGDHSNRLDPAYVRTRSDATPVRSGRSDLLEGRRKGHCAATLLSPILIPFA